MPYVSGDFQCDLTFGIPTVLKVDFYKGKAYLELAGWLNLTDIDKSVLSMAKKECSCFVRQCNTAEQYNSIINDLTPADAELYYINDKTVNAYRNIDKQEHDKLKSRPDKSGFEI